MKNSADEDPMPVSGIEDDMLAFLNAAKSGVHRVARSSEARHLGYAKKAFGKAVQINFSLLCAPYIYCVVGDIGKIKFGQC
jgi:hypothetical protein